MAAACIATFLAASAAASTPADRLVRVAILFPAWVYEPTRLLQGVQTSDFDFLQLHLFVLKFVATDIPLKSAAKKLSKLSWPKATSLIGWQAFIAFVFGNKVRFTV